MEKPRDFLTTPIGLTQAIWDTIVPLFVIDIITAVDMGAGTGHFGKGLNKTEHTKKVLLDGVDEYFDSVQEGYYFWFNSDWFDFKNNEYDLVIGNPPFTYERNIDIKFIQHALDHVVLPEGLVVALMPFVKYTRYRVDWDNLPLWELYAVTPRPAFNGKERTGNRLDIGLFVLKNGYVGDPVLKRLNWKDYK